MQNNAIETQWAALEGPSVDTNKFDIWGFLRRRKEIVVVLMIVGAGIGYLIYQQQTPQYRSIARLEVINRTSDRLAQGMLGEKVLEDAEFVISSRAVLQPAFEEDGLVELATFRDLSMEEAFTLIVEELSVELLSGNVIELMFDGPNEQDTAIITNAIANKYIARQMESYESQTEQLEDLLSTDLAEIRLELEAAELNLANFLKTAPLLSNVTNGHRVHPLRARLAEVNEQIDALDVETTDVRTQLELIQTTLEQSGSLKALELLIDERQHVDNQPNVRVEVDVAQKLHEILVPLVIQETTLRERVGSGHPELIAVRRQIEATREQFNGLSGEVLGGHDGSREFVSAYINSRVLRLEQMEEQRKDLQEMEVAAENSARMLQDQEYEHQRLRDKVERLQNLMDDMGTSIRHIELNADVSGVSASLIQEAGLGELVFPLFVVFLGAGGMLGGTLGLCLGYVVELADKSFRKPEEIVSEFGLPIIGHIPYMKEQRLRSIAEADGGLHRTMITAHLPRSRPAEAYRAVRTAIFFTATGDPHRVIQVTSPAAGDGKSTLAANLSISLAQSGKKTILVESDFRRPNVHRMTGVSNDTGIVNVLRGESELADVIQTSGVDDFYVLPGGRRPRNPSELLTRPEYEQLLDVLRQKFEYVIVDTPPVLVVTDPCSVAARVDAVIVCMRLSRHTRDFGKRTLDQLRDIGANVLGVAVNGVEEADAYGYGSYNYSDYRNNYYHSPSYAYAYNYSDGSEGYFSEEDETVPVKRLLSTAEEPSSSDSAS